MSSVQLLSEGFEQAVRNLGGEIRQIDQIILNLGGELERQRLDNNIIANRFENLVNQFTSSVNRMIECQSMVAENQFRVLCGNQIAYGMNEFSTIFADIYAKPEVIPESKPELKTQLELDLDRLRNSYYKGRI